MGHVIVTARSLGWLLISLSALLAILAALLSPRWIVASPGDSSADSLGLFMRCRLMSGGSTSTPVNSSSWTPSWRKPHCGPLPSDVVPGAWMVALVFLGLGTLLSTLTSLAGLLACCVHAICGKSILGVCGTVQAGAGVLYLASLSLFAGGWGADRVHRLCPDAAPFYLDSCSLGWATYSACIGTVLSLLAAVLSVPADRAAGSDKVQDRIFQGHTLVCII